MSLSLSDNDVLSYICTLHCFTVSYQLRYTPPSFVLRLFIVFFPLRVLILPLYNPIGFEGGGV